MGFLEKYWSRTHRNDAIHKEGYDSNSSILHKMKTQNSKGHMTYPRKQGSVWILTTTNIASHE